MIKSPLASFVGLGHTFDVTGDRDDTTLRELSCSEQCNQRTLIDKGHVAATLVILDGSGNKGDGEHIVASLGLDDLGVKDTASHSEAVEVGVCGVIGQSSNEMKEHWKLEHTTVCPWLLFVITGEVIFTDSDAAQNVHARLELSSVTHPSTATGNMAFGELLFTDGFVPLDHIVHNLHSHHLVNKGIAQSLQQAEELR